MYRLQSQIRGYPWGSRDFIAKVQGRPHPTPGPEAALKPEELSATLEPPPTRAVAVRAHRPKKGRNFLIGAVIGIVLLGAIVAIAKKNAPPAAPPASAPAQAP